MDDDEIRRLEKGLITLLVRAANEGDTQAANAALTHVGKNKKPKQKRRRYSKKHSTLGREEYLILSLAQVESAVTEATDSSSWQAVVNGKRLAIQLREDLDKHRETNNTSELSPEETKERMVDAMQSWPDDLLEHAIDLYCVRHDSVFFLSRDGERPIQRTDGGWRAVK